MDIRKLLQELVKLATNPMMPSDLFDILGDCGVLVPDEGGMIGGAHQMWSLSKEVQLYLGTHQGVGTVRFFLLNREYGFIIPDTGEPDVLMHLSSLDCPADKVVKGTRVMYDATLSKHGMRATSVKLA